MWYLRHNAISVHIRARRLLSYDVDTNTAVAEFHNVKLTLDTTRLPPARVCVGSFVLLVGELETPEVLALARVIWALLNNSLFILLGCT